MIILIATVLGAAVGALQARRRKGKLADMMQYAFVYGVIFALIGLFITIILTRSMG